MNYRTPTILSTLLLLYACQSIKNSWTQTIFIPEGEAWKVIYANQRPDRIFVQRVPLNTGSRDTAQPTVEICMAEFEPSQQNEKSTLFLHETGRRR